jgi:hypothetical protein
MASSSKIQGTIKRISGPLLEPESEKKVNRAEYHVISSQHVQTGQTNGSERETCTRIKKDEIVGKTDR